jgi:hypothetical protein
MESPENREKMHYQAQQIREICDEIMVASKSDNEMSGSEFRAKWREIRARVDAIKLEVFRGSIDY